MKFRAGLLLAVLLNTSFSFAQEYHIQEDFEDGESDNFPGWTVGGEGVAATASGISGKGAKFRGISSSLETNGSYSYVDELIFSLKVTDPSLLNSGVTFNIYISQDEGITWDSIWAVVLDTMVLSGTIIDSTLKIESEKSLKLKFESKIPNGTLTGEYPFTLDDVYLTKMLISENNADLAILSGEFKTVSDEEISFSELEPGIFVAHDSVAFDEDNIILSGIPLHMDAEIVFKKQPNPQPGKADTALLIVTAADGSTTKKYQAVVARSLYQCKIGFLAYGGNAAPSGWITEGGNFSTNTQGDGGEFPGTNGMRIYNSSNKGLGVLSSPVYSSISTISFAAKFSKTDDESLLVKKSMDNGVNWTDVKTYTPAGGEIPSYSTEQSADPLSTQTLDIFEENVMIAFQYEGASTTPRLMIDDISFKSNYDPEASHPVIITVYDLDNKLLEGAAVVLEDDTLVTGINGLASFDSVSRGINIPYTISKDGNTFSGQITVTSSITMSITFLPEELDLFLALGQSNMAGRAEINAYVNQEIENVSLLNDEDVWTPAINPMNLYSNIRKDVGMQKLGPSYSFAKTLSKYVDKRIGMVVNARGGTPISDFATGPYHDPIMEKINSSNRYGKIKGVIWHQGEGDRNRAASYMGKLNSLVNDIRDEIGEDAFFVAGQLGPWDETGTTTPKYGIINDTIAKISNYVSNSDYVHNKNLTDIGDNSHFNLESQILLGQRYAKKMLKKLYNVDISIIDINIAGDGFVVYEEDSITSANDYSYTSISNQNVQVGIHAGNGKEFVQLQINGVNIEEATGSSSYHLAYSAATDSNLAVEMTVREVETIVINRNDSHKPLFFPNPARYHLSIIGTVDNFSVSVYDLRGQLVLFRKNERNINIQNLSAGTYLIMLDTEKERKTEKLMVY